MSGGYFNFQDSMLKHEIFGWSETPSNVLEDRELSEILWDFLNLLHDYDYYKSGDSDEKRYLEAKNKFKQKWLDNRGVRVKYVIDSAIQELKEELYQTYVGE